MRLSTAFACHGCGRVGGLVFYEARGVPVHSVLLMPTREEALSHPKGDVVLAFCPGCGLISNVAFDPDVQAYSSRYEETQGFSATFSAFARRQAADLVERYGLRGKTIIEIGCGKGEFLSLLCELGQNRGIGFDPSYVEERGNRSAGLGVTFIKDFYSERYAEYQADFVCCKMTLEHVHRPANLIRTIRQAIGPRSDVVVFLQVPSVTRILRELAFWDIYYEHCSYFSAGSLARLLRRCDFDPMRVETGYDDQYLMLAARPGGGTRSRSLDGEDDVDQLARDVRQFSAGCPDRVSAWAGRVREMARDRRRAVLWGSGSKAVAFLTTLNLEREIEFVVDINPYRQGTCLPGTGQEIVAPEFLRRYGPDVVIVMNPIYREEIQQHLSRMELAPDLLTV